jgi:hypothetical protein
VPDCTGIIRTTPVHDRPGVARRQDVDRGAGEPGETRTPNQLIKSQLLCH